MQTFSNIGYINKRLLLNCSNKKKVNVRRLKKIIYIPHYGIKDKGVDTIFLNEKKFDGYVYKTTLILTLINYGILLLNTIALVLVLTIATWFLKLFSIICCFISVCYSAAIARYTDELHP